MSHSWINGQSCLKRRRDKGEDGKEWHASWKAANATVGENGIPMGSGHGLGRRRRRGTIARWVVASAEALGGVWIQG